MEQQKVTQEQLTKAGVRLAFMMNVLELSISSLDLIVPPETTKENKDIFVQYKLAHKLADNLHQTLQGVVREIDDVAYLLMELGEEEKENL